MKNKSFKRILSIILALVLTLGMLVVPAYAEDDNELEIISSVCVTAVTPTTISVKKINNVYYSLDNTTNWTTDATFAGLYPNTQHKVYYRFGTTGTPKELATVTTKESESRKSLTLIDSNAPYTLAATGYSSSFELKNDLTFRFYLRDGKYSGYSNFRVLVEQQKFDTATKQYVWTSSVITPSSSLVKFNGVDCMMFVYPNIASFQVSDNLNITLYAEKDGKTYIAPLYSMSIEQSALDMCNGANSSLLTLLADFLNYCAASQTFFGYNTSHLANANLGNYASYATSEVPNLVYTNETVNTVASPKATYTRYGLGVGSSIALNISASFSGVNPSSTVLKVSYTSSLLGKQTKEFKYNSTGGYYSIDSIASYDFDAPLEFAIYQGDTAISNTVRYSIETRCKNDIGLTSAADAALVDVMKALMKYSHSAKAYFS